MTPRTSPKATAKQKAMGYSHGAIAKMFQDGAQLVAENRTENLFQELETRQLTEAEEKIIQNRVELQRRMLAAYEKQEKIRKIEQLREVHPDLTDEEAERALEICNGREDEAAGRLASGPEFLRQIKVGPANGESAPAPRRIAPAAIRRVTTRRQQPSKPLPDGQVFVGSFRGRGHLLQPAYDSEAASDTASEDIARKAVPRQVRSKSRRTARQLSAVETSGDSSDVSKPESDDGADNAMLDGADDTVDVGIPEDESLPDHSLAQTASMLDDTPSEPKNSLSETQAAGTTRVKACHVQDPDSDKENIAEEVQTALKQIARQRYDPALKSLQSMSDATANAALNLLAGQDKAKASKLKAALEDWATMRAIKAASGEESPKRSPWRPSAMTVQRARNSASPVTHKNSPVKSSPVKPRSELKAASGHVDDKTDPGAVIGSGLQQDGLVDTSSDAQEVDADAQEEQRDSEQTSSKLDSDSEPAKKRSAQTAKKPRAISARGHTNRGRVRQKSHKSAELVEVGSLRVADGWYNQGYIFPEGFKSKVNFRSSLELDQLCVHECTVIGKAGEFWPQPTFKVVAMDRPEEALIAKSCTGCWTGILKRINNEITRRRKAGENLPPPPKTAIAGPEYFGFNQHEISEAVEGLDTEHRCDMYWEGKADRACHAAGMPVDTSSRPPKPRQPSSKPKRRRNRGESSDEEDDMGQEDEEGSNVGTKWSAVSRHERYKKRCGGGEIFDEENPLPGWMDPVTLEQVATPAISPWGHVMGMATWKAVLSDSGKCPFTQRPLTWEQCQSLTKSNIDRYKDRIIADEATLKKFGLR